MSRDGKIWCAGLLGGVALWADTVFYIRNLAHTGIGSSVVFPQLVELFKNAGYSIGAEPIVFAGLVVGFSPGIIYAAGKIACSLYDVTKPYAAQIIPKTNELISKLKPKENSQTDYMQLYNTKISQKFNI